MILFIDGLVLNKKENGASNLILNVFTKELGKINLIAYGIRKSKKRDISSTNLLSISNFEIEKKNNSYILINSDLKYNLDSIYKNVYKLQISLYIIHCLNEILEYDHKEDLLYEKVINILKYLNNSNIENKIDMFILIIAFLRRIMIEIGIYNLEYILDKFDIRNKYILLNEHIKNGTNIEIIDLLTIIFSYEKYINMYFDCKININKIIIN